MTYEETINLLQDNHIYPLAATKDLKTGGLQSIEVTCSPFLHDTKTEYLKKLLGEGFTYTWFPNQQHIEIKHKKR